MRRPKSLVFRFASRSFRATCARLARLDRPSALVASRRVRLAAFSSVLPRSGAVLGSFSGRFSLDLAVGGPLRRKTADPHETLRLCSETGLGATRNRPKIAPGASRNRLSEKNAQKSRLGVSRAHFLVAPGGPGVLRGRPEAVRGSSESFPNVSRSVPGAPPKPPESPQIAPRTPGNDFGRPMCDPCNKNHAF